MAVATNEDLSVGLTNLQPLWHEKASRELTEACPATDLAAGWKAWQEHLRKRRSPALPRFLAKKSPAILWGWPSTRERDAIQTAIESPSSLAEIVIGDDVSSAPGLPMSLEMVALAYALPKLAAELPCETWWFLLERLYSIATAATTQRVDSTTNPLEIVRHQLLAGELPLALGYLFPELRAMRALRDDARAAFSESLIELTDGQGLLNARLLTAFGALFACWTRSRSLGQHLKRGAWSRPAEVQYEWLVRNAIRLADVDGNFLLSSDDEIGWTKKLFRTALTLAGDRGDYAAARVALPRGSAETSRKIRNSYLPSPSLNSDWSSVTIMSDGWSQRDARLALSYTDESPTIDLTVDGERLFSGIWTSRTTCDGKPVQAAGEWEQLCWESGKRFDFLELGLTLSAGLRLERQVLFGREDRILYIADMLSDTTGESRSFQHSFSLPLGPSAIWKPETETRDGLVTGRRMQAAVMPLALREWRSDPRIGSLAEQDRQLTLSQEANGHALCCPLFIDLDRKRSTKERTWRQLTVGDTLEVVPADIAVGYRAQSGDDQWLIYRSLGKPGNRTLLGHNVAGEFCAGRFVEGKFKEWIEIEAV
ncbi:MAG TPA: hypothetical protein VHU84_17395 [Lacipirellulaceae bacterium]|jgi:hypothetical protein|nr:hypothetical protein [Lacipirellulaceae bacterium]